MKLVEILARELKDWPENINELTQSRFNNEVYVNDEDGTSLQPNVFLSVHHNEGKCYPAVTRAQWEAERARILKMDALVAARDNPPISQYEQELWDRVAASSLSGVIAAYTDDDVKNNIAHCFEYADAFMAERAKRLKGSQ